MRAAVADGRGSIEITTVPDPSPGPDDLVLRVEACGICGSDLKLLQYASAGTTMGHEFSGEVVAVGERAAERLRAGDRVAALPVIGCGTCPRCQLGDPARCVSPDLIGVLGSPGAFAEFVRVSARETFRLPEGVDAVTGALVEPLAVGLHVVRSADLRPWDTLLVLGAGPVGQAVILWARHLGVREIVASDPLPARRAAALAFGATAVIAPNAEDVAAAFTAQAGGPADVVAECVGKGGMLQASVDLVAPGGRVVMAGAAGEPDPVIPGLLVLKEVSIRFAGYYTRDEWSYALRMLAQGRIDPRPMVTATAGLGDLPAVFAALGGPTEHSKVVMLTGAPDGTWPGSPASP